MLTKDQLQVPVVKDMFDLARRIHKGERLSKWIEPETIPSQEYRERIAAILLRHGLLESSGGPSFFKLIQYSPHPRVGEALCDIALDEVRHGRMLLECLDPLGVEYRDAFRNMVSSDYRARMQRVGMSTARGEPSSWADVMAFTMLIDPAGILIVGMRLMSNYGPLARASARTLLDEEGHAAFWEKWGQDQLATEAGRREVQASVDRFMATSLGTLGRPKAVNPNFAREQELGLWKTDPGELQPVLKAMLKRSIEPYGLRIPEVAPDYGSAFW
jgi:1,2-phenylacetyl-CoA epoxidase catalytic subunit